MVPEEGSRRPHRRLLRLVPEVGLGEEVARWPARSGNDRFAMTSDAAGRLYIVGWRERGGSHALVRLDWRASAGLSVVGWASGGGRVIGSTVRASSRGVSFYVQRGPNRVEAVGWFASELRDSPGGERRCF